MRPSIRHVPVGETPRPFLVVGCLLFANFAALWSLGMWAWVPVPDPSHSFGIRHRGGEWRYFTPLVGRYLEYGFWAHFVLLGIGFVLAWRYRDRLHRVEPPPPSPPSVGAFLGAFIAAPILLSLVGGFVVGILWRWASPAWASVGALPFLALSLGGVELAFRELPDPRHPPLGRWACRGIGLLLSATTMGLVAWLAT